MGLSTCRIYTHTNTLHTTCTQYARAAHALVLLLCVFAGGSSDWYHVAAVVMRGIHAHTNSHACVMHMHTITVYHGGGLALRVCSAPFAFVKNRTALVCREYRVLCVVCVLRCAADDRKLSYRHCTAYVYALPTTSRDARTLHDR